MTDSLDGKVAVVTGSAGGIGRGCAVRLAEDGADIGLLDLDGDGIEETARRVRAIGRRCHPIAVDLMDREATRTAFARLRDELGFLEILHNNAGGGGGWGLPKPFASSTAEQWDHFLALNLTVAADCTRLVVPEMIERGTGRIINTSSERAFKGGPMFTDYSAAKAGLIGFTRSLAVELAPHGVTVNAVCPGVIRTPLTDAMPEERIAQSISEVPAGRIGEAQDIAHAVSYLASPGASYVTGEHIMVTGGRTIR